MDNSFHLLTAEVILPRDDTVCQKALELEGDFKEDFLSTCSVGTYGTYANKKHNPIYN